MLHEQIGKLVAVDQPDRSITRIVTTKHRRRLLVATARRQKHSGIETVPFPTLQKLSQLLFKRAFVDRVLVGKNLHPNPEFLKQETITDGEDDVRTRLGRPF